MFQVVNQALLDVPLSNKGQPLQMSPLRHLWIDDLSDPEAVGYLPVGVNMIILRASSEVTLIAARHSAAHGLWCDLRK
jgi:hypothetical protein